MSEAYRCYQKGLAALDAGLTEEAIVPLERAKRLEPDSSSINEALGRTYLSLRFYDRAIAEFSIVLERDPLEHYAHYCLGRCYERLGDADRAARHYKLARTLGPTVEVYKHTLDSFLERRDSGSQRASGE